jgi:hypothetical protein
VFFRFFRIFHRPSPNFRIFRNGLLFPGGLLWYH